LIFPPLYGSFADARSALLKEIMAGPRLVHRTPQKPSAASGFNRTMATPKTPVLAATQVSINKTPASIRRVSDAIIEIWFYTVPV